MPLDIDVTKLVPHDGDMVLIETIESRSDHGLIASLEVGKNPLFVEQKGVPTWVGLEYMGQAVAAFAGLTARDSNLPVKIGFLVSARKYEPTLSHFQVGTKLLIEVNEVILNNSGLRVFECAIRCDTAVIVSTNLNVYMPNDIESFMAGISN